MLQVHDRCVFRNYSGSTALWRESLAADDDDDDDEASRETFELPDGGEPVPVRWRPDGASSERRLMRVALAGDQHDWCLPFSPFEPGSFILKCRPKDTEVGASNRYLRLQVRRMNAPRVLRALPRGRCCALTLTLNPKP